MHLRNASELRDCSTVSPFSAQPADTVQIGISWSVLGAESLCLGAPFVDNTVSEMAESAERMPMPVFLEAVILCRTCVYLTVSS